MPPKKSKFVCKGRSATPAYKTILHLNGGGLRTYIASTVLIEVEKSIKRYLMAHPDLLPAGVTNYEDLHIDVADYFDLTCGVASAAWANVILASKGGNGIVRNILDKPEILDKYGYIHEGSAEVLKVFFREYGGVIYPPGSDTRPPVTIENLCLPELNEPSHQNDSTLEALHAFVGDLTLDDLSTSFLTSVVDLKKSNVVLFTHSTFRDPPVSSGVRMEQTDAGNFKDRIEKGDPRLDFSQQKNFLLKEIGTAATAVAAANPAFHVTEVGSNEPEFYCLDSALIERSSAPMATRFLASELGGNDVSKVAVLSIGTTNVNRDRSDLGRGGALDWFNNLDLQFFPIIVGVKSEDLAEEFKILSGAAAKPYQYLRADISYEPNDPDAVPASNYDQISFLDDYERIGKTIASAYAEAIDTFVSEFMFA